MEAGASLQCVPGSTPQLALLSCSVSTRREPASPTVPGPCRTNPQVARRLLTEPLRSRSRAKQLPPNSVCPLSCFFCRRRERPLRCRSGGVSFRPRNCSQSATWKTHAAETRCRSSPHRPEKRNSTNGKDSCCSYASREARHPHSSADRTLTDRKCMGFSRPCAPDRKTG